MYNVCGLSFTVDCNPPFQALTSQGDPHDPELNPVSVALSN